MLIASTKVFAFNSTKGTSEIKQVDAAANHSIWQTKGYGYILEVIGEDIRFFDMTKHHCLLNEIETGEYPSRNLKVLGETAELDWNTVHPVQLKKLAQLPLPCQKSLEAHQSQSAKVVLATEVFDVFWFTFAEHFAFNDELNWDWSKTIQSGEVKLQQV